MDLAELQKEAHAIAKDHGWWCEPRTFGDLIALVHSELSEALEAYRKYEDCLCHYLFHPMEDEVADAHISRDAIWPVEGVPMELADVVIRVADMAEYYGMKLCNFPLDTPVADLPDSTFGTHITACHMLLTNAFVLHEGQSSDKLKCSRQLTALVDLVGKITAHYGIDLDAAIEAKMEYNRTRSYRHGGKAL